MFMLVPPVPPATPMRMSTTMPKPKLKRTATDRNFRGSLFSPRSPRSPRGSSRSEPGTTEMAAAISGRCDRDDTAGLSSSRIK
jgi:hypothetical protein